MKHCFDRIKVRRPRWPRLYSFPFDPYWQPYSCCCSAQLCSAGRAGRALRSPWVCRALHDHLAVPLMQTAHFERRSPDFLRSVSHTDAREALRLEGTSVMEIPRLRSASASSVTVAPGAAFAPAGANGDTLMITRASSVMIISGVGKLCLETMPTGLSHNMRGPAP